MVCLCLPDADAWHSNDEKARAYRDASDDQKKHDERIGSGAGGYPFGGVDAPGL